MADSVGFISFFMPWKDPRALIEGNTLYLGSLSCGNFHFSHVAFILIKAFVVNKLFSENHLGSKILLTAENGAFVKGKKCSLLEQIPAYFKKRCRYSGTGFQAQQTCKSSPGKLGVKDVLLH